jgi:hypothetical protein
MNFHMSSYLIAEITLVGMGLDLLGGFYLAYDLLGGSRGPLRAIARTIGYIALFFLGYIALLGLAYALIGSVGMGILLTAEYRLAADTENGSHLRSWRVIFGLLRGAVLGLASMAIAGALFGAVFGALTGIVLVISFLAGFSPTDDYERDCKPRLTKRKILASLLRALIVCVAGIVTGLLTTKNPQAVYFGLKLGIAAGAVNALVGSLSPMLEWWIENLPSRRLGTIGLWMILLGMILQSMQYWVVVYNGYALLP